MPKTYKTDIIGYKFDELHESIQQCIYEHDYENFVDQVDFNELEEAFRKEFIADYGADAVQVIYDVSYSQGSGACCTAELDVDTVLRKLSLPDEWASTLNEIKSGKLTIDSINVIRCGAANFYCHEKTCRVEIEYTYDDVVDRCDVSKIVDLEEMLNDEIRELLCDFHKQLEDYFEEATSFEAYCDHHDEEVIYTETGKIVDSVFIENAHVIEGYQLSLGFDEAPKFWRGSTSS